MSANVRPELQAAGNFCKVVLLRQGIAATAQLSHQVHNPLRLTLGDTAAELDNDLVA
jgi:hypothetical protein